MRDLNSFLNTIERAKREQGQAEGRAESELEKMQSLEKTNFRKPTPTLDKARKELTRLQALRENMKAKIDEAFDKIHEAWIWN